MREKYGSLLIQIFYPLFRPIRTRRWVLTSINKKEKKSFETAYFSEWRKEHFKTASKHANNIKRWDIEIHKHLTFQIRDRALSYGNLLPIKRRHRCEMNVFNKCLTSVVGLHILNDLS